jgi:hypothetical protein
VLRPQAQHRSGGWVQSLFGRAAQTPGPFCSLIVSDFPEILAEFRGKWFSVLWRGSRDGFGARDFHRRCDGRANTLTVILDTAGNLFGGFTPVKWESHRWNKHESDTWKVDHSLRSFLFTLKNPHNIPARRFALKAEEKGLAIVCDYTWGPCFCMDMNVSDNSNANASSSTSLDKAYANDTGLPAHTVFTGSPHFQVKEIEVFEITE